MTITCPHCGSVECESNSFKNVTIGHIANGAIVERKPDWLRHGLSELVLWAAINLANMVRLPHKCSHCGNTF